MKRSASLNWRPGVVARNTAHATALNFARIFVQAISLVLLARTLGADQYGVLTAAVGLYFTASQLCGLGSGVALARDLARGKTERGQLKATQGAFIVTGAALALCTAPIAILLLGRYTGVATLAVLAFTELVVVPSTYPKAYFLQAQERVVSALTIQMLNPLSKAVAAGIFFSINGYSLLDYCLIHMVIATLASAGLHYAVAWDQGPERVTNRMVFSRIASGLPFALGTVATTARNELDKTVVLRLSGPIDAGQYAAGFRVMQAAMIPVSSLVYAITARMFRSAGRSMPRLYWSSGCYAAFAAAGLWVSAPILPAVLGPGFEGSVEYVRWLCVPLVTGSLRQAVLAGLTTSDQQWLRNVAEGAALVVSLSLLFALVPLFGGAGAALALLSSDCISMGIGVFWHRARSRQGSTQ